jgi:hypothetical protein
MTVRPGDAAPGGPADGHVIKKNTSVIALNY